MGAVGFCSYAGRMAKATINQAASQRVAAQAAKKAEVRLDQAIEATAARARGNTQKEVESILRAEMSARGIQPSDTAGLAQGIVEAPAPPS